VAFAREGPLHLLSLSGSVWLPVHGPWRLVKRGWLRGIAGSLSSGHARPPAFNLLRLAEGADNTLAWIGELVNSNVN
jgi:hypothetical protein